MRLAVISDVQGNVEALRAVLRVVRRDGVRKVVSLGDLIGYHAFPLETLALIRAGGTASVAGNHDLMAAGRLDPDGWDPRIRKALNWTQGKLSASEREYLSELPVELRSHDDLLFVHSTLHDPSLELREPWQFYEESLVIRRRHPDVRVCFSGHTQRQQIVEITAEGEVFERGARQLALCRDSFFFVNPGSIGSPADEDYRAAYAIYDDATRRIAFRRATYDRLRVIQENIRQGLSSELRISRAGPFRSRAVAAARSIRTRILAGIP
jgi:diadenosine tetraphosphatase ApaH/serine/threonine PP2A family protein phosphatase